MPRRVALAALLAGAAVLGAAAPAQAHSFIVGSTPAEGETLTALPEAFSVTANETLLDLGGQGAFQLQIRDAAGSYYGDGCVDIVDATMSAVPAIGGSGDYWMLYQVVSADGHPVSGEIAFHWEAPVGFSPDPAHPAAPVCGEDPDAAPAAEPEAQVDLTPIVIAVALVAAGVVVGALIVATRRAVRRGRPPGGSDGTARR